MAKSNIKVGDKVLITTGSAKGSEGSVVSINTKKQQVVVEGGKQMTKAVRPTKEGTEGGLQKLNAPVHISNVKKID
jgi:large subunit ribosomal protein L24